MTRQESIQRIVWALLAHVETPQEAVLAASTMKPYLGQRAEQDYRNLLRAAGLFACDDDGFYIRYASTNTSRVACEALLAVPPPTHLLTVPVPVEPRMRIAYGVFTGLLLKHLYQGHRAVPLRVAEGMAALGTPDPSSTPVPPLSCDPGEIWQEFQNSKLVSEALADGIVATLSAVGNIGAIALTDCLARGPVLGTLLDTLPLYERKFQAQGGMRLDFYLKRHIDQWRNELKITSGDGTTVEGVWTQALEESNAETGARSIASKLVDRAIQSITIASPTMQFRSAVALWRGEGTGPARKRGLKEEFGWNSRTAWKETSAPGNAEKVDRAIESALIALDRRRCGARQLDLWLARQMSASGRFEKTLKSIQKIGEASPPRSRPTRVAGQFINKLVRAFHDETLVPLINPSQIKAALQNTLANLIAWTLAQRTEAVNVAVFGWPLAALRVIPEEKRFALRFIKKSDPPGAKALLKLPPLGSIVLLPDGNASLSAPFDLRSLSDSGKSLSEHSSLPSVGRCIVCGSATDLLEGAKTFLPESKKRWYEAPTTFVEPRLCSNCAFLAYLSAIYPNDNTTVVEFPTDNFLELFALHEHLQGVSGLVALKVINRTATLSVFSSRYLLLSKSAKRGQMDSKTQVYMQLRKHEPLLRRIDWPMRVQVEGSQPNFWSEIRPHVAVGLSYFAGLPAYYETADRKGASGIGKIDAQRMTRALAEGRPFATLYLATQARQPQKGFGFERDILPRGVRNFEREFIANGSYAAKMACALGGPNMDCNIYDEVIVFSNYLLDLVRPLVEREVRKSGSAVSGIARKYTELIARDFAECRAAKFLYVVCQEADQAEKKDAWWCKRQVFEVLNPAAKDDPQIKAARDQWQRCDSAYDEAEKELKNATNADRPSKEKALREADATLDEAISAVREAWDAFRKNNPKTELERRLAALRQNHGNDAGTWSKFLQEVEARTLALLLLNVHRARV